MTKQVIYRSGYTVHVFPPTKPKPFALQAPPGCGMFYSKSVELKILHYTQYEVRIRMWVDK